MFIYPSEVKVRLVLSSYAVVSHLHRQKNTKTVEIFWIKEAIEP